MINKTEFQAGFKKYNLKSKYPMERLLQAYGLANGCGAKGGIQVPDSMYFVSIIWACIIHDIEWGLAINTKELQEANERFDNNLKRITDQESCCKPMAMLRRLRIAKYVDAVEVIGTPNYARERGFI